MSQISSDAIEQVLEGQGHRLTAPRRELLTVLMGLGDTFVAETVVEAAPDVGRATVFRTLRLFQDLGVLCQVILDDGAPAYRIGIEEHHHHIVCGQCGVVQDFSSSAIERALQEVEVLTGFAVDTHRVELYGRCSSCSRGRAPRRRAAKRSAA